MEKYPLTWPSNKVRTPISKMIRALFGKKSDSGNYSSKKDLTVHQATERLMKEIDAFTKVGKDWRIDPEKVIISTNLPPNRKGMPQTGMAQPSDPGVAVYLQLDGKDYCFPCDKWDRVADNIAAIAAHLNAMRGIEWWGVGDSHDVYTGFKALPPGTNELHGKVVRPWRAVFGLDTDVTSYGTALGAYRFLIKKYHTDGSHPHPVKYQEVIEAWENAKIELGNEPNR